MSRASWVNAVPVILVAGVVLYLRLRRTRGEQLVRPGALMGRLILLGLIAVGMAGGITADGLLWAGLGMGAGIGVGVAFYSLRHTRFVVQPSDVRYQVNPYIGGAIIGVTALRVIDDALFPVSVSSTNPIHLSKAGHAGAVTGFFFYLFLAYWVTYYIGLWRTRNRLLQSEPKTPA